MSAITLNFDDSINIGFEDNSITLSFGDGLGWSVAATVAYLKDFFLFKGGIAGGQVANGGTESGESMSLFGSAHATKGPVNLNSNCSVDDAGKILTATGANAGYSFGDGDSGFYENTDDQITVQLSGSKQFIFTTSWMEGKGTGGGLIKSDGVSATSPAHSFRGDTNTGVGRAGADILSLIAGAIEMLRLDKNTGAITSQNGNIEDSQDIHSTPAFEAVEDISFADTLHYLPIEEDCTLTASDVTIVKNKASVWISVTGGNAPTLTKPAAFVFSPSSAFDFSAMADGEYLAEFHSPDGGTTGVILVVDAS